MERPSYLGALQAFKVYGPEFVTLPLDDQGLQVEDLIEVLAQKPKFLYLLPNFHNPAGVTLATERREFIVDQARRFGVPIVEDDPYGQLRYEGEHRPAVIALDREATGTEGMAGGNVIYLSSFSKVLAPGLRLGWVIAPEEVIAKLVQLKQGADLHSSTFCQMVAYEVASEGFLDENIQKLRTVYRERRDAMLEAMSAHFPDEVTWTRPEGGLFLWLTLPRGMDSERVLADSLEENVAFVPGAAFYADGPEGARHSRLNYSCVGPELINEGIERLAGVLKDHVTAVSATVPM